MSPSSFVLPGHPILAEGFAHFRWTPFTIFIAIWLGFGILLWIRALFRWVRAVRNRPRFTKEQVIFQEWMASGSSRKNLLTRFGGARHCLRLVMIKDVLWVTSWFPFSLVASTYDLEHVIPVTNIVSVARQKNGILVTFKLPSGMVRELSLWPRNPDGFTNALVQAGMKLLSPPLP